MSKYQIKDTFDQLKQDNNKAFIAYLMAGDGGLDHLLDQIQTLEKSGVDLIEIGVPFSDPAADGPVIQKAGIRALKENVSLNDILSKLSEIKDDINIPYVLMSYYNPIFKYGLEQFKHDAVAAGVSGLIVPDLPLDEEKELSDALEDSDLAIIRLVTLTTTDERLKEIVKDAEGFIYAVAVNGITGAQDGYSQEVYDNLKRIKEHASIPVCSGFGISSKENAKALGEACDGVIVGSKIVELLHNNQGEQIKSLIPEKHFSSVN